MLAWTADHSTPSHLSLREVPDPVPGPHDAVIEVRAFAPNHGDLEGLPGVPDGTVPGWDAAGVVVAEAADGTGPRLGQVVASLVGLGAHEVISSPSDLDRDVWGVLDLLGGPRLVRAFERLTAGGTLVALGHAAGEEERFAYGDLFGDGNRHDRSLTTFFLGAEHDLGPDMSWLAAEIHAGRLDPVIADVRPWRELPAAFAPGAQRGSGKVVLTVA